MKEFDLKVVEANLNNFASKIHQAVYDCSGGIDWHDEVVDMNWGSRNSCDGFSANYDYGCRSFIRMTGRQDPSYHLCKEHTAFIEKEVEGFGKMWFENLQEHNKSGCKTFEAYIKQALEKANKEDATAYDVKDLNDFDDSLYEYVSDMNALIIIDTWFYSADNIHNKSKKDLVLIQVHLNFGDTINWVTFGDSGKDTFIVAFEFKDFIDSLNINGDAYIDTIGQEIYNSFESECVENELSKFID